MDLALPTSVFRHPVIIIILLKGIEKMRARYICGLPAFLHYSNSIIPLWYFLYLVV